MMRILAALTLGLTGAAVLLGRVLDHFLCSAPLIVGSAFLIAWAAEALQFHGSQGLDWRCSPACKTLPEFAVEADIAWNAARHTEGYSDSLVTANFTGRSGCSWLRDAGPSTSSARDEPEEHDGGEAISLDPFHSVEIVSLFPPRSTFSSSSTAAG